MDRIVVNGPVRRAVSSKICVQCRLSVLSRLASNAALHYSLSASSHRPSPVLSKLK